MNYILRFRPYAGSDNICLKKLRDIFPTQKIRVLEEPNDYLLTLGAGELLDTNLDLIHGIEELINFDVIIVKNVISAELAPEIKSYYAIFIDCKRGQEQAIIDNISNITDVNTRGAYLVYNNISDVIILASSKLKTGALSTLIRQIDGVVDTKIYKLTKPGRNV